MLLYDSETWPTKKEKCLQNSSRRNWILIKKGFSKWRYKGRIVPLLNIQGVSRGIVNILGGGSMDYAE